MEVNVLVLERHRRSMNTLSIQRPRPSIEMRIPAAASMPVAAALVNWLPWSVLKISGRPKRASACSSAETQNDTSTARLAQSITATGSAARSPDRARDKGISCDPARARSQYIYM